MHVVQMAMLFDKVPQNITILLKNIYKEGELDKDSTCKEYLQVAHEGCREVTRSLKFYNLDVIISVGYRVKLIAGTRFDGFVLIADLVKSAKRSVAFIAPFATIEVLKFAAMRATKKSTTTISRLIS